jgi:2-polyprenyl-6-methoxyphenol hydroxylase-like FAD-dependent oxidoreductase
MTSQHAPVLIVGAGLAGLSTALFLGLHGVRAVAVDRHPGTANQPKARGQMPPIMEAFRAAGVSEPILAAAPPGRPELTIVICESVLGIGSRSRGSFGHTTTVLFAADLAAMLPDTAVLMYYVQNPALPGRSGAFVSTDEPGEYVAGMSADPDRTDEQTVEVIRTLVGIPDLDVQVLGSSTWEIAHRVADRMSSGRVHLIGDAVHLMPPTGGQGGNIAMLDGLHLAWRLAAVVKREAGPGLLASHSDEQLPYGEAVAGWQSLT